MTLPTSNLDGSAHVKRTVVPFFRARLWKVLRNVSIASVSVAVGSLILGEMTSFNASQKVLPSTSRTRTIWRDFSLESEPERKSDTFYP